MVNYFGYAGLVPKIILDKLDVFFFLKLIEFTNQFPCYIFK